MRERRNPRGGVQRQANSLAGWDPGGDEVIDDVGAARRPRATRLRRERRVDLREERERRGLDASCREKIMSGNDRARQREAILFALGPERIEEGFVLKDTRIGRREGLTALHRPPRQEVLRRGCGWGRLWRDADGPQHERQRALQRCIAAEDRVPAQERGRGEKQSAQDERSEWATPHTRWDDRRLCTRERFRDA